MKNLMEKLPHCDKRIFAVATFKSQTGNALGQVQKLLSINKNILFAGYTIAMPGNSQLNIPKANVKQRMMI